MEFNEEETVSVNTRDIDLSLLRKSLQARGKTIDQLVNCIYYGTTEVRQYILNESDVIIECKACRNLFRALPNFVAHKRIYCMDSHLNVNIPLLRDPEEVISVNPEPPDGEEGDDFIETSIGLAKQNLMNGRDMSLDENYMSSESDTVRSETQFYERICNQLEKQKPDPTIGVRFEPIEGTDVAVRVVPLTSECDAKLAQENNISKQKVRILSHPNKIQSSSKVTLKTDLKTKKDIKLKADFRQLRCLECNRTMSSRRYLVEHILNLHSDKRRYFSCPYCKVKFRYFHCVVRHLRRVHECSKDVIDNMRENLRNSSWIENSPNKANNKVQPLPSTSSHFKGEASKIISPKNKEHSGKVQKLKVKLFSQKNTPSKSNHTEFYPPLTVVKQEVLSEEESAKDSDSEVNTAKDLDVKDMTGKHRPPTLAQRKKMAMLMDKKSLTCLQCNRGFSRMSGLVRHVAHHLGWKRFKCKLCMYSGYDRYVCKSHIERNHLGKVPGLTRKVMDYYIVDLEDGKIVNPDGTKSKKLGLKLGVNPTKKSTLSSASTDIKPVTVCTSLGNSSGLSSVATVRLSPLSNEQLQLSKGCAISADKSEKPLKGSDLKKKLLSMVDYRTLKCLECNRTWNKRSHLLRHAAHHIGWKRFKCKLCVFSGYDRYMCKSHLKRCHLGKIHGLTVKVLDYYIVDMMEEENDEV
ncbi:finger 800-like [Octopus vulgaris]|uniref:Finger 800-like n=2 Tax=Octopus TaxID=6643 RepID=A0AA36B6K2_OCTVU|nr:zinc finger protein Xfin-like [Octopus sinensis]CAI9728823.1 finger 800-like [Octopus vulgaris]